MSDGQSFKSQVLTHFYLSHQVDVLQLAVTNMLEMVAAGEIDLILEQSGKSDIQKLSFIEKIVSAVESPELKAALVTKLKEGNLDFFREETLEPTLKDIQKDAEHFTVVRITVAITFKPADLEAIATLLSEQLENKTVLELTVDTSLLGGVIIQQGTALRDYSIKTRLEHVASQWKQAVVEA